MKRKKYVSRQQKARRCLIALLLLAVLFVASGGYGILPAHAIRETEICVDCGRTAVLRKLGRAGVRFEEINRMYVSANEKALLVTAAVFSPRGGWNTDGWGTVDCTKERPLHAGIFMAASEWEEEIDRSELDELDFASEEFEEKWTELIQDSFHYDRVFYAYGRVDDRTAALVRILAGYETEGEWVTIWSAEIPRVNWFRKDGQTYFAQEIFRGEWFPDDSNYEGTIIYRAELLDGQRELLYRDEELVTAAARMSPVPSPKI